MLLPTTTIRSPHCFPFCDRNVFLCFYQAQRGLATLGSDLNFGLATLGAAVTADLSGVRADIGEVKRDLASVRASVAECRQENMEFFSKFTASLETTQQGIDILRVRLHDTFCFAVVGGVCHGF